MLPVFKYYVLLSTLESISITHTKDTEQFFAAEKGSIYIYMLNKTVITLKRTKNRFVKRRKTVTDKLLYALKV